MKSKEIRDLIEFISQTGLNEVKIETEELKLSIKRDPDVQTRIVENSSAPSVMTAAAPVTSAAAPVVSVESTPAASQYIEVKSPMIGTFYRSANPDSPSFVNVGDKIKRSASLYH
jgi:acetyl-CoA carboxylase biotin carboxyl carrier protein